MRTIAGRMKGGHWALAREEYEAVCQALDAGHLIVYPTDTLYGLGGDPFEARNQTPRSAHVTPLAQRIIAKPLPGPVTILLRATSQAPPPLVSSTGLIGVRVPDHPVAIAITKAFGPITTTSANLHGGAAPPTCHP